MGSLVADNVNYSNRCLLKSKYFNHVTACFIPSLFLLTGLNQIHVWTNQNLQVKITSTVKWYVSVGDSV